MTAVTEDLHGEEGAISMAINPGADNMTFVVDCASFQPPHMQLDEGSSVAMGEITAPAPPTAGLYRNGVTFAGKGGHVITCFNGTTRVRQRVFVGDYPAWDAKAVQDNLQKPIEDAAAIAATTGVLG